MCRTSSFCPVSLIVLLLSIFIYVSNMYKIFRILKKNGGRGVWFSPHSTYISYNISYIFTSIHHLFPYTQEAVILLLQINVLGLLPICRGIKM